MHRAFKLLLIALMIIVTAVFGLGYWGFHLVNRSLPVIEGEIQMQSISRGVEVFRDGYHVPHIIAGDERELFLAQAYVTAQDRLWQMDLWRRMARGRLSEILGPSMAKQDRFMLQLGIGEWADRSVPFLSADSRRIFETYANGVNLFIEENSKRLPVEFLLLDYTPGPWQASDCLSILRLYGWYASASWKSELVLGALIEKTGLERALEYFPGMDKTVCDAWPHSPFLSLFQELKPLWDQQIFPESVYGCSGVVVSGSRSVTGYPVLAFDPLHTLNIPALWYEIHLAGSGMNVAGLSIPGVPLVYSGLNDRIAWCLLPVPAHDTDLIVEIAGTDSLTYRTKDRYRSIKKSESSIPVRNQTAQKVSLLETHHGPVIGSMSGTSPAFVSLRWTGHRFSDEGLALYRINRASDREMFSGALALFHVPAQNALFADRQNHIGYYLAGGRPGRAGYSFPVPGWDEKGDVLSRFSDLFSIEDPPEGYCIAPEQTGLYPADIRYQEKRTKELISGTGSLSVSDLKRFQSDITNLYALDMLKYTLPVLQRSGWDDWLAHGIEKLSRWSGQMKEGSSEAVIFETFLDRLLVHAFQDSLGDLFLAYKTLHPVPYEALLLKVKDTASAGSPAGGNPGQWILNSYAEALTELREKFGTNMEKWSWGQLHPFEISHLLGGQPILRKTLSLGPFHTGGSSLTLKSTGFPGERFLRYWSESARMIVDLENPDNSISIIPAGQSGQPLDEHYRDQLQLYLRNLYHPNLMDTVKVRNSGLKIVHLLPVSAHE